MFYATNKLRHSTYFCTPSGKHNKAKALLCSVCPFCIFFSYPLQKGCKKTCVFLQPLVVINLNNYDFKLRIKNIAVKFQEYNRTMFRKNRQIQSKLRMTCCGFPFRIWNTSCGQYNILVFWVHNRAFLGLNLFQVLFFSDCSSFSSSLVHILYLFTRLFTIIF